MEGKLYKSPNGEHYYLTVDGKIFAEIGGHPLKSINQALSIKNCEAVANGYDLDELAYTDSEDFVDNFDYNDGYGNICRFNNSHEVQECYIKGFQKALSILGDKKFSESNIRIGYSSLLNLEKEEGELSEVFTEKQYRHIDNYIQSLQQTEWDVKIEMICPHPMDTYRCGLQYGCDGDGCNHPEQVPYLDSDGCLILRKI